MLTRVKLHAPTVAFQRRPDADAVGPATGEDNGSDLILLVPTTAIASIGEGRGQVWIVDTNEGNAVARRRDIATTLSSDEGFTIVTSGLRLTDRVIVDPPAPPAIRDGTRLKVLGERTISASEPASPKP